MVQTKGLCNPAVFSPIETSSLRNWVKNRENFYRISCFLSHGDLRTSRGGNLEFIKLHFVCRISSHYLIIINQIRGKDLNRKICMIIGNYLRNATWPFSKLKSKWEILSEILSEFLVWTHGHCVLGPYAVYQVYWLPKRERDRERESQWNRQQRRLGKWLFTKRILVLSNLIS